MLSNNKYKIYSSLKQLKYRYIHQLFSVEGLKSVEELLFSKFETIELILTEDWLESNADIVALYHGRAEIVTEKEMITLSNLTTPPGVIAIAKIPDYQNNPIDFKNKITLVLDGISDPGNMGTIIRTADWFGLENIICSEDTVDVFNHKVVQASMGSIFRIKVHYQPLTDVFANVSAAGIQVYGAFIDGADIYKSESDFKEGILVIGSESLGIRPYLKAFITQKLSIPNFSRGNDRTESLNASIAAAIMLAEIRRKQS
jgi:TrmH family RNA methyltransferase